MKQDEKSTNTYSFLLDINSEAIGRDIIKATGMILLSITRYTSPKTDFGSMYVKVIYDGSPYEIVSSTSFTLKDLCMFFIYAGMEVVDVNSLLDEEKQTPEQSSRIISLCKAAYINELEQKRLQKIKEEEDRKREKYYEDHMLKKAKNSITWVLDKIQVLLQTKRIHIAPKDEMWIEKQLNDIKKQRMGSNYEKIKVLMQDLFIYLYSIEDAHYASISEKEEISLFEGTHVSNYDLQRQVEVLEEVQYHSAFGGTVLGWRQKYGALPFLPYILFLKKDLLALFSDLTFLVYILYDIVLLGLISVLVVLSLVLLFYQLLSFPVQLTSLYFSFVTIGWFGLLLYLASFLRKQNTFPYLIGLFVAVVALYFISLPIIKNSFALQ